MHDFWARFNMIGVSDSITRLSTFLKHASRASRQSIEVNISKLQFLAYCINSNMTSPILFVSESIE